MAYFWTFLLKNIDTGAFGICFPFALLLIPCGAAGFVAFITVLKRIVQLYSHWRVWIFFFLTVVATGAFGICFPIALPVILWAGATEYCFLIAKENSVELVTRQTNAHSIPLGWLAPTFGVLSLLVLPK
jgi:hypothetical protein